MLILSKKVDYYDYLSKMYGVDLNIVYDRLDTESVKYSKGYSLTPEATPYIPTASTEEYRKKEDYVGLSVCGVYYLLKRNWGQTPVKYSVVTNTLTRRWNKTVLYSPGSHFEVLREVSKDINQPVFLFGIERANDKKQFMSIGVPHLASFNFETIVSAPILYQDIAYFIANVLNEGIDIKPPSEVSNSDKITQAGFDLKQSFRHRKD